MTKINTLALACLLYSLFPPFGSAQSSNNQNTDQTRERYLTPEDKRDASLGREITDGVVMSWLVETEYQRLWEDYGDSDATLDPEVVYTVQLASEIDLADWLVLELVAEAEKDRQWRSQLEEGILAWEWNNWSADVGRLYVPFGEYYSQFISDIALEAGESRGTGLVVDYNVGDSIEVSSFFLRHDDNRARQDKNDWGLNIAYQPEDIDLRVAVGYLSAIVEDDDDLREIYDSQVKLDHAWTASVLLSLADWLITAESLRAERRGADLPSNLQTFKSTNVEIGYYGIRDFRFSLRHQSNNGTLSSPERQFGIGVNWVSAFNFSLSLEYLWNTYPRHEEVDIRKAKELNLGLVIEF